MPVEGDDFPTGKGSIRRFGDLTGMHGVPNIAVARSWTRRVFWIILTLAATGACLWQLHSAVVKLSSRQTSTTTTVVNASPMNFPAITICNLNPIRFKALKKYNSSSRFVQRILRTIGNEASEGPSAVNTNSNASGWSKRDRDNDRSDFTDSATVFSLMTAMPPKLLGNISYSIQDVLVDCAFKGRNCVPEDYLTFRTSRYGNCFLFNSGMLANGSATDIKTVKKTGPHNSLELTLYVDQNNYIPDVVTKAGYKVLILDRHTPPLPENGGYEVSPGLETSFSLRTTIFERASSPYGNCINFSTTANQTINHMVDQLPLTHPSSDIYLQTCEQLELIEKCQCNSYTNGLTLAPPYGHLNNTSVRRSCDVRQGSVDYKCVQDVNKAQAKPNSHCKSTFCKYQECIVIRYDATPSSSLWPAERSFGSLMDSIQKHPDRSIMRQMKNKSVTERREFIYKNFVKINIFFQDLNIEYILTEGTYGALEFIADLGGIFGLWLGFSILTFFELVELGIDLIIALAYCNKVRESEKKVDRSDDDLSRTELTNFSRPSRRAEAATIS